MCRICSFVESSSSLEQFVHDDDDLVFGHTSDGHHTSLQLLTDLTNTRINNSFTTISSLYNHLEQLHLLDPENLRPGWDSYFMVLYRLEIIPVELTEKRRPWHLSHLNALIA